MLIRIKNCASILALASNSSLLAYFEADTDHEVALKIGQRLRDSISRLQLAHGAPEAGELITISIGAATQVLQENEHPELLLARADQALYAAKQTGTNRVVSADKALAAFKTSQPETKAKVRVTPPSVTVQGILGPAESV